jgi:REP element-mobilizing transposase RayT
MSAKLSPPAALHKGRLRRLAPEAYLRESYVHWTMAMERRATGWLDALAHARLREALLHACVRHGLACAVYTLMPDHAHFLVIGLHGDSDQRAGIAMLRRSWREILPAGICLQRQAYDHVLRETERERGAFASVAHYILENPVRAGLVEERDAWPYSGSLVPGYPSLDPARETFWESFWLAIAAKRVDA